MITATVHVVPLMHFFAFHIFAGVYSATDLKQIVEESKIMTNFDHPNVMKMLGVAITKQKSLYVVMPYMSQGSLLSYLRKHRADLTVENEDMTDLVVQEIHIQHYSAINTTCLPLKPDVADQ